MNEKPKRGQNTDAHIAARATIIAALITAIIGLLDNPNTLGYQPLFVTIINMNIIPTPTVAATSINGDSVALQLDNLVGAGNWFCFPNSSSDIGINMPDNFEVQSPIQSIEHYGNRYSVGQYIPRAGKATAKLDRRIEVSECPNQEAIDTWLEDQRSVVIDQSYIDTLVGTTSWQCNPDGRVDSIYVYGLIQNIVVSYPFNSLDTEDTKYGVDEIVTNQSGTLWVASGATFPRDQCR